MAERGERPKGRKKESHAATLSDLGVSKTQSSRWQHLASMSKAEQEQKIANAKKKAKSALDGTAKRTRVEMRADDEARIAKLVPVFGKYRTLVIDPPWDYEWLSIAGRASPGYATMDQPALLAMADQVKAWSEENSHLYLWTTNNFMTRAVELVAAYGFQHRTVLTWRKMTKNGKEWFGLGSYFRNSTEHVLFATRVNFGPGATTSVRSSRVWSASTVRSPSSSTISCARPPTVPTARSSNAHRALTFPISLSTPMNSFLHDNKWQRKMRDKFLVLQLYKKWSHGFLLLDGPKHKDLQQQGIDTIAILGRELITIDDRRGAESEAEANALVDYLETEGNGRSVITPAKLHGLLPGPIDQAAQQTGGQMVRALRGRQGLQGVRQEARAVLRLRVPLAGQSA
jgi:N6-adenosine-specific RNA methylase IME4